MIHSSSATVVKPVFIVLIRNRQTETTSCRRHTCHSSACQCSLQGSAVGSGPTAHNGALPGVGVWSRNVLDSTGNRRQSLRGGLHSRPGSSGCGKKWRNWCSLHCSLTTGRLFVVLVCQRRSQVMAGVRRLAWTGKGAHRPLHYQCHRHPQPQAQSKCRCWRVPTPCPSTTVRHERGGRAGQSRVAASTASRTRPCSR